MALDKAKIVIFNKQRYLSPSWDQMGQNCFSLAQKILAERNKFDIIVALSKGGLTWSRTLADYLQIVNLSVIQIKFYSGIYQADNKPVIIQSLPVSVAGLSVLLFDDVVDTGETLKVARDYMFMAGASKVSSASLYFKKWAKIKPDYFTFKTDAWIIFPHEIRETINLLFNKWKAEKLNRTTIIRQLLKLKIPKKQLDYFSKKL